MNVAVVGLAAFGLGALPFGLWVGRLLGGVDVRRHGSGNLGATNVYRTLGARLGLLVLALDAGKGVAAVFAARALAGPTFPGSSADAGLVGAVAAVLGHSFTPLAGFKGGKGAATAAGAMLAATPAASSLALAGFVAAVALSRRISVGSLVAAAILPLALWLAPFAWQGSFAAWTGTAVGGLIVLRHRANIGRLLRGEEPAFRFGRDGEAR